MISTADMTSVLTFGSQIGGVDREQHVDIPAQATACRIEISARHATSRGWENDQGAVTEDTPNRLGIGFCDARSLTAQEDDLSLHLVFARANRTV